MCCGSIIINSKGEYDMECFTMIIFIIFLVIAVWISNQGACNSTTSTNKRNLILPHMYRKQIRRKFKRY